MGTDFLYVLGSASLMLSGCYSDILRSFPNTHCRANLWYLQTEWILSFLPRSQIRRTFLTLKTHPGWNVCTVTYWRGCRLQVNIKLFVNTPLGIHEMIIKKYWFFFQYVPFGIKSFMYCMAFTMDWWPAQGVIPTFPLSAVQQICYKTVKMDRHTLQSSILSLKYKQTFQNFPH